MAVPTTNLDRTQTVTLANPTPPTNSVVTYQGTPPTPQGLAPAIIEPPDIVIPWITADPLNGAAAPGLSGLAEADGNAQMAVASSGRVTGHSVLDDYTESPNSDHPSGSSSSSSLPAWVPANAVIHIDLVGGDPQGRAWVQGTGEVAVNTLLGADANADENDTTGYNPAWLTPDGYVVISYVPALIGVALPMILDAATVVFRVKQIVAVDLSDQPTLRLGSFSMDDAIEYRLKQGEFNVVVSSYSGSLFLELAAGIEALGAINILACTTTATRFDIACNGSEALAGVVDETDRPPGNPLVFVTISMGSTQDYALQSITLYDPLPSTAGLSELSEVT